VLPPPPSERTPAIDTGISRPIAGRWSVRAFDVSKTVDAADVRALVDAARTAPSAYNLQPWRLCVTGRGTPEFASVLSALADYNAAWAWRAALLVVGIARDEKTDGTPCPWADYDLGQATALLTVEANARGLGVCQMAGLDVAALTELVSCVPGERVAIVSAVGHPASDVDLPVDALAIQERARRRRSRGEAASIVLASP